MRTKIKILIGIIIACVLLALLSVYVKGHTVMVLSPKGPIAEKERALIFFALGLSVIVVLPVFSMACFFAWKYRETNHQATYLPDWDRNIVVESIWWGIPTLLILILSVVAWNSSHTLDPFRPIASDVQPLTIEVVALDWKWLFIYPEQGIATVNYAQIPNQTAVDFEITSDTVMNSFWVPELGGQIYAMPGMATQLHLLAYRNGSYYGSSANISGAGFAGMHFIVKSTSLVAFNKWADAIEASAPPLNPVTYNQLAKPSSYNRVSYYTMSDNNLFLNIINKYMTPNGTISGGSTQNIYQIQGTSL